MSETEMGGGSPSQVVSDIVAMAHRARASDIHFDPAPDGLAVRMRVDGLLLPVLELASELAPAVLSRIKILGALDIVDRQRGQDGQTTIEVGDATVDVRVATMGTHWGERAVLRLLDRRRPVLGLGQLGMTDALARELTAVLAGSSGMVLVAGPTGSGKTTTLHACLRAIDTSALSVATVEDPIEYVRPDLNQTQINLRGGVTFAAGLRAILRHDPDIILVGEIRDEETARIAVSAALSGHLVISSIHAVDAPGALVRLLEMGIEPFLVSAAVGAVVGQRLLRRNCRECLSWAATPAEAVAVAAALGVKAPERLGRGDGCPVCLGTGYMDRAGIFELMVISEGMRQAVLQRQAHSALVRQAMVDGMVDLRHRAWETVCAGTSSLDELMRVLHVQ